MQGLQLYICVFILIHEKIHARFVRVREVCIYVYPHPYIYKQGLHIFSHMYKYKHKHKHTYTYAEIFICKDCSSLGYYPAALLFPIQLPMTPYLRDTLN